MSQYGYQHISEEGGNTQAYAPPAPAPAPVPLAGPVFVPVFQPQQYRAPYGGLFGRGIPLPQEIVPVYAPDTRNGLPTEQVPYSSYQNNQSAIVAPYIPTIHATRTLARLRFFVDLCVLSIAIPAIAIPQWYSANIVMPDFGDNVLYIGIFATQLMWGYNGGYQNICTGDDDWPNAICSRLLCLRAMTLMACIFVTVDICLLCRPSLNKEFTIRNRRISLGLTVAALVNLIITMGVGADVANVKDFLNPLMNDFCYYLMIGPVVLAVINVPLAVITLRKKDTY